MGERAIHAAPRIPYGEKGANSEKKEIVKRGKKRKTITANVAGGETTLDWKGRRTQRDLARS